MTASLTPAPAEVVFHYHERREVDWLYGRLQGYPTVSQS